MPSCVLNSHGYLVWSGFNARSKETKIKDIINNNEGREGTIQLPTMENMLRTFMILFDFFSNPVPIADETKWVSERPKITQKFFCSIIHIASLGTKRKYNHVLLFYKLYLQGTICLPDNLTYFVHFAIEKLRMSLCSTFFCFE